MTLPILQTKFYVPPPRTHMVARPHLLARLARDGLRPLTLVSAPAGFGKTTLVSEWLAQRNQSVAWLSLNEDDNDPARFLHYLLAALQLHHPQIGETARLLLDAPQAPPPKAILTLLLNDLSTLTTPLLLVLDDYHLIHSQPIHEALAFLIDHLPPTLQLVITSRIDPPWPLSRWRVRNQLTEIRAADLRFTADEAAIFLNEVMGLKLTSTAIATLETRTEGWIAGLQLAALSMHGRSDLASFIEHFTGSHSYIIDYLVEEVLQRQSAEVQHFLLQTSLLERFCAPLCDAITGRNDGQAMIEQLQRANLFLIALDDERQWYRYHHLFAEVLQARLRQSSPASAISAAYERASHWFAQQGLLNEAVASALAGTAYEQASHLIEANAILIALRGQANTVRRWLHALPTPLRDSRPRLHVAQAAIGMSTGEFTQVEAQLQAAETLLSVVATEAPTNQLLTIEIMAIRAVLASFIDGANALSMIRQALDALPEEHILRLPLTQGFAYASCVVGELAAAEQALFALLTRLETAGEHLLGRIAVFTNLGLVRRLQGRLGQAQQFIQSALALANHEGHLLPMGAVFLALGESALLLYKQNKLDEAEQTLQRFAALMQQTDSYLSQMYAHFYLAWVLQARGDGTAAMAQLERADTLAKAQLTSFILPMLSAWRVRLWLQQGNLTAASQWAEAQVDAQPARPLTPFAVDQLALVRVWLAQKQLGRAEAAVTSLIEAAATRGLGELLLEVLALQALIFSAAGNETRAFASLTRALLLAEPEGNLRLFVDEGEAMRLLLVALRFWLEKQNRTEQNTKVLAFLAQLLLAFSQPQTIEDGKEKRPQPAVKNLIEPLSERELEILRLVNDGLSNSEIAEEIIVTVGTVKKHLNNIFGKLGVGSRTQALVRAREVALL